MNLVRFPKRTQQPSCPAFFLILETVGGVKVHVIDTVNGAFVYESAFTSYEDLTQMLHSNGIRSPDGGYKPLRAATKYKGLKRGWLECTLSVPQILALRLERLDPAKHINEDVFAAMLANA